MNKVILIGNLTRDPETRQTNDGMLVTAFTVAVNRRTRSEHPEADYFRVSAWGNLGETCARYLQKGRKVCVTGTVRAQSYTGRDGQARASLEVTAAEVEFLSPKAEGSGGETEGRGAAAEGQGYTAVEAEDLPF